MENRPEYVICVLKDSNEGKHSYCGRDISMTFHFVSVRHAKLSTANGDRFEVCEDCSKNFPEYGKYVVFEGIDGCGKTTQSKALVAALQAMGKKAVWSREPGSPLIDLKVRDFVLSDKPVAPRALELLLQADRAAHAEKIKELLDEGTWVVSDRSFMSGLAYGICNGHPADQVYQVIDFALAGLRPDVVFLLDLTVAQSRGRIDARGEAKTREEKRGGDFTERVRMEFLGLSQTQLFKQMVILDAMAPEEDLKAGVLLKLRLAGTSQPDPHSRESAEHSQ